jgi:3-hydroxyisobutyrate dehydrogenase-like beta-hydroxyacid dehydrogenase
MKEEIGFIGLGNMGLGMARNILKAGFPLIAHDLRREPLAKIKEWGGRIGKNPREIARQAKISIIVVLNYEQIEQLTFGPKGLREGLKAGDVVVVMSTISPAQVRSFAGSLKEKGIKVLDAPISGGREGAEAGTLSIMVGGPKDTFRRCREIFRAMGRNVYYLGPLGSGLSLKLVNNLLVAVNGLAVAEAMVLGRKAGLDPKMILEVIPNSAGDSWMFRNRAYRMVKRDFACRGELDILVKDLSYILQMGKSLKSPLVLGALASEIFQMASSLGWGKEDDAAVVKVLEKVSGIMVKKGIRRR